MGVIFFEKNRADIDEENLTITVTDAVATDNGQDYINLTRNRNNRSGFSTTGSTDAANTQIDYVWVDEQTATDILLKQINWKAYTIQKSMDGISFSNFSTSIAETVNADADKRHSFTEATFKYIRIIIDSTMVVDDDKVATQIIFTKYIGTFTMQPTIKVTVSKSRKDNKALSGKIRIARNTGAIMVRMTKTGLVNATDLALIENLYRRDLGFLLWLCGGTITQFAAMGAFIPEGYRKKDIYLMTMANEYEPNFTDDNFNAGLDVDLEMVEML